MRYNICSNDRRCMIDMKRRLEHCHIYQLCYIVLDKNNILLQQTSDFQHLVIQHTRLTNTLAKFLKMLVKTRSKSYILSTCNFA